MTEYKLIIGEDHHKIRLDKALSLLIPEISRNTIVQAIKNNQAKINQLIIVDSSMPVKKNDIIHLSIVLRNDQSIDELMPTAIALDILFEDDHLMIINKPAGLTVHPNNNKHEITLVHGLVHHTRNLSTIGGPARPGIVHRLDKDTSGLMVVAKTDIAHQKIAEQLQNRILSRKYKALVWHVPSPLTGIVNANIGRHPIDRTKRIVQKYGGKHAITHYCTREILQKGVLSQIECTLETGRTHQIRVHLSYIGCSIFGDPVYGHHERKLRTLSKELQNELKFFKRQALHSWQIKLFHPITNQLLEFETTLPTDIQVIKTILAS